jgi:cytoskeletal protein CcmA (bactofilin family)
MGTVSGEIVCKGVLTIEQNATAKARIEAREATIRGRVDGDIVCSGRLLIASTAHVTGTIKAGALVVEDGASIRGNIETASAASADDDLPSSRAQRKAERGEPDAAAAGAGRWTRSRDVPTFALVSSDDRNAGENG